MEAELPPRWDPYVLESADELLVSWQRYLGEAERNVLFVLGKGFDPRMCIGLERLLACGGEGRRTALLVEFDEGENSPSNVHSALVDENEKRLESACGDRADITRKSVEIWSHDGRRVGPRSSAQLLDAKDLKGFTDVVIDISAFPRGIYFPLVAKALYLLDKGEIEEPMNLHVFVSEDSSLDKRIRDEGLDETASYLHPFSGGLEVEATTGHPRVWIPILGEGQEAQLVKIFDLVVPDEICPVLPSPCNEPRRTDDLVLEYRDLLFDRLRVESGNLVYASEQNPFEVYRQLRTTIFHYIRALRPLGGSKTVLSALSSKLLSVGVLLVAYELKQADIEVGVAHVEAQGYVMEGAGAGAADATGTEPQLFGLWLAGECYAT